MMNGTYYKNPTFPGSELEEKEIINDNREEDVKEPGIDYLPMEQSYIENILRLNKGSFIRLYASFPDSLSWRDRKFEGILEQAGRDHVIISSQEERCFLIPMIYVNYIEFDKKIVYRPYELKSDKAD